MINATSPHAIGAPAGVELTAACVLCNAQDLMVFFEVPRVPVNSVALWPSREAAANCASGRIRLAFCRHCGAIANLAFDPELIEYNTNYDNSLHFSPRFQAYAEELASYLIEKYSLRAKQIIEIGCGKGEFLAMLCRAGNNHGVGFDPTYVDGRVDTQAGGGITIVREYYSERHAHCPADFLCCRHVLEHVWDPRAFLASVRQAIGEKRETAVYFEVPNGLFMLREKVIWDVIYEHCCYYTPASLAKLFTISGFDVLSIRETFAGQYLCIEARPSNASEGKIPALVQEMFSMRELEAGVGVFSSSFRSKAVDWESKLSSWRRAGKKTIAWGAGAKGTIFLNTFRDHGELQYIVDINPHKRGKFVPGTGQEVVSPEFLRDYKPDFVIVMNANYQAEIASQLKSLGLHPEFECV